MVIATCWTTEDHEGHMGTFIWVLTFSQSKKSELNKMFHTWPESSKTLSKQNIPQFKFEFKLSSQNSNLKVRTQKNKKNNLKEQFTYIIYK